MTIDEAIKYYEKIVKEQEHKGRELEKSAEKYHDRFEEHYASQCFEYASEYEQLAEWLKELKRLRELVIPITDIPKDYNYDTETNDFYVYRHKYTGHEIHVAKPIPIYKIDKVISTISRIEQVRDKDKNAGEYPYNRCVEIVKEVFGDDK